MKFAAALAVLWAAVLVGWVGRALQVQEKTFYGRRLRRIGLVFAGGCVGGSSGGGMASSFIASRRWCRSHRARIDLEAIAERYGAELAVAEFVNRSVCSECGARWPNISISLEPVSTRSAKIGNTVSQE